ncbi:MAG: hypothetical protein J6X62_05770 [Bacteroidales bacterium]|nr:hypothetical protein [Bacteroidales bacterium]
MERNQIIYKLDSFIRKYYKNRLIKGTIYSVALLVSLFLLVVVLEYFGYFSVWVRTVLFWLYLAAFLCVLGFYVVSPLLKMYRLGRCISYDEAARIIGRHFPEVEDKLLNLLQLQRMGETSDDPLLLAGISQKTASLSPIPFTNAVNLKGNRKYLVYAVVPLSLLLIACIVAPSFITEPSKRIINHSTYYERPAPFSFVVLNQELRVPQQEDFMLNVEVRGDVVPNEAYVNVGGKMYHMQAVDKTHFSYLFKNVQKGFGFHIQSVGVESAEYVLEVLPKPVVVDFQVALSYPSYTRKSNEVLNNEGNITVPEGTVVEWIFQTKDVDTLRFLVNDASSSLVPDKRGSINHRHKVFGSLNYGFITSNRYALNSDTLKYAISAISDNAPLITVTELRDSVLDDRVFFKGRIKDDYGFSKLVFTAELSNAKDSTRNTKKQQQLAVGQELSQEFYYSTDFSELGAQPGDQLIYYFEIWDNDAVNGAKCTRSQVKEIKIPTQEELESILESNTASAQKQAEMSMSELKALQEEINELMRKLVDKKELTWQDKKQMEELAKKQQEVKSQLEKMQQQLKENARLEEKYRDRSQKIAEKQRELDRLMNEVLNEEMKEMMKEIEKLMEEVDKKKVQEQLEQLKTKNEDIEKQIDQDLELMKRLELEKKVEETMKKTEELADKQRELSEKSKAKNSKEQKDELLEKQKELNNEFQEIKKEIEDIQSGYKKLDKNADFDINKELLQRIDQKQKSSESKLQQGKNKEASEQQKSAADDLDELSEKLAEAESAQQNTAEDAEKIRQLLKNLVALSVEQESLIGELNSTYIQDPKYQEIIASQNKIKSSFVNVEDSLRLIAKRQLSVASVINKELEAVNSNISKSLNSLLQFNQSFYGNARNYSSGQSMQYSMTSFNNLALVLAESLDKMQNEMRQNQQQKKNGSCKNSGSQCKSGSNSSQGKGKPSAKSLRQMQEELNKQLNALKKQMGNSQGSGTKRTRIGDKSSMSEEFARMAAQQEQIRRLMQEYGNEMKQQSGGSSKIAQEIEAMLKQMEQTETDLVNRTISQQTINRQQQILTRLLEHEKAEMQREKEQRRESREAKDIYQPSPADMEQFKRLEQRGLELFSPLPPTLSNYYKNKANDYFYKF